MVIFPNNATPAYISGSHCLGQVQNIALYNKDSGYVMVEGKKVFVNKSLAYEHYLYQISLDSVNVTWYDPKARKFICWNKNYSKLIAKRSPKLEHCIVKEQPTNETGFNAFTKYTKRIQKSEAKNHQQNPYLDVEIKFNKKGLYPTICEKKRHIQGFQHHARHVNCGEANFLLKSEYGQNCKANLGNFCKQMQKAYKRSPLPKQLRSVCPDAIY